MVKSSNMSKKWELQKQKTTITGSIPRLGLKKENTTIGTFQRGALEKQKTTLGSKKKGLFTVPDGRAYRLVAAIEIGTSYSGYAYCQRREGKSIAQHIVMNPVWMSPDKTQSTLRVPTSILLNDKKEFEAFGYEADHIYTDMVKENRQHKVHYFRRFKTKIFGVKDLRMNSLITDENGKQFLAIKVFSMTIRYLKSQLLNDICLRGMDVAADELMWVITVPAIWSDMAKQFMRRAAEKAGIETDMLRLCLEPEAASVFCQNIPSHLLGDKLPIYKSGTKYVLADLGGGITDIVVHEKRNDGLREISRGIGAKLGGGAVDNIFMQFMTKLLGNEIVEGLIHRYKKEFIGMMRDFEQQKRTVTPQQTSCIELKIPACLEMLCAKQQYNDNLANVIFRSVYKERVKIINKHRLRIDAVLSNEFFRAISIEIAKMIAHSLTFVKTAADVTILVLTGAFAESVAVQEIMHKELLGKTQVKQIICPPESDLAVLKGAVMFGHNPSSIASRVNRETIGLKIARLYNPEMHSAKRRSVLQGIEYVFDIFSPFLTIGTRIPVGFISHQALTSTEPNQKKIVIDVYRSELLTHNFVTDDGCEKLGKVEFDIPMPSEEGRTVFVDFVLGETELWFNAIDKKTNMQTKYYFPILPEK